MDHPSRADENEVATIHKIKIKRPSLYRVFLHNDDLTTMIFVIFILEEIFKKNEREAKALMLQIHNEGSALCGTYIFEIAETKMNRVHSLAEKDEYPLVCSIQPEKNGD